jgi:hypothetical protein
LVLWSTFEGGTIQRAGADGTDPRLLAEDEVGAQDVAVRGTSVYWANGARGTVMTTTISGSEPATTIGDRVPLARGVAVDDSYVYWTSFAPGSVGAARIDGSMRCTISRGDVRPFAIASDGEAVYWTRNGAGEIAKAVLAH